MSEQEGHEVILVAPRDPMCDLSVLPKDVKYIPVILSRTGTNPIADLHYYRKLRNIYKTERPDYIFHYTIKPNIYGTLAAHALGIRNSAMIAGLGHVYSTSGISNRVARWMYKYAMHYPEHVMVLNQSNQDTLLANRVVKAEKLLWLQGGEGVDLKKFIPQPLPGNKKPVFLMVCRLLYEKGYNEYIAAAKVLQGQAEFRIMGPIESHPTAVPRKVIATDVANKLITYIAYSPDVITQIKEADCIVLPSYYGEGLSRVLMEGLAMARPIITTDIPGCRETVIHETTGYLCSPRNIDTLIDCCQKFLTLSTLERARMGKQGRILAENRFNIESVIQTYKDCISHKQF